MLQSMPDAAGTHRLLQGLPQAERHAFIATLSPQSRSNLMAYIAALERDLAQMKQAFSSEELAGGIPRTDVQDISDDCCSDVGSSSSDSLMDGPSGCVAELQDELHVLLRQKELLESHLAKTQALATSLAGCDLYGKVCQELVDSEEVELSPWEESSTSSEPVDRSRSESGNETLGSLMHALQNASPEERRKAVADISQERFMQLISSMPEEDEEVDLQGVVSSVDGPDGTWIDQNTADMTESHPSSLRRQSAASPNECSALCLSSCNKPSEPRNTKPLGQLQVDGELPAHESTHVLLRLPPRSRAHSAAAELSSAWERCLGKPHREQGLGSLKDSGVDGEAISAWLGGETSSTMCCARILEATVRGNFCSAPAQKEMSRTVELYGRGETGGAGCLGGCLGALVGGLAGLCLPEDAVAGELMSEMLPSRALPQEPAQAVASAAKVLAADGFDTEAVNFEFRRQCLQAHPQRRLGGLSHFLQVHCDLEVLRQTAKLLQSRASTPDDRDGAGATAAKAAALAQAELHRTDSQAVEASALLSPRELEEQNEQMSRYLLDLSWQKDAMKAMLEHLQNHEAYAVLGVAPDISDGDLAKAYKAAAMRLHPDKGGNAEQFKAARAAYDRILELRQGAAPRDEAVPTEAAPEAAPTETTRSGHVDPASPQGVEPTTPRDGVQTEAKTVDLSSPRQEQEEPCSEEESEESEESDGADKEASASPVSETEPLQDLNALDAEAVVKAIPVESVSRQAEHALDGAQMCMKVARLASEATGTCRSWSQLLRCGTHLLDSTHCVTQASQSVSRCAVGVPSDLIPLLEKIKTAEGMTRQAVSATRDLMQCTEIISEKGLRATELSNRLLQQSKELASTLQSVAGADEMSSFACRTMAKTYEGLATLARETADATAAAAVMVGDAQKNAHVLKEILDKLQCKAKAKKERSKDEDEEAKDADTSSDEESAETTEDRACSNRRLLLKLNTEVLDLQKEMRNLVSSNPALMPEVGVAQKEWIFRLAAELIEQTKWKFTMLGLHGQHGPSSWDEAMQETLRVLQAAANWDGFATPLFDARILRAAALVDANLLSKMLQDVLQVCEDSTPPGSAGDADDQPSHARHQYSEAVNLLCRHGTAETVAVQA